MALPPPTWDVAMCICILRSDHTAGTIQITKTDHMLIPGVNGALISVVKLKHELKEAKTLHRLLNNKVKVIIDYCITLHTLMLSHTKSVMNMLNNVPGPVVLTCGTTRMSEKMMAASNGKRLRG